jgi:signal transduction histidine kinase
VTIDNPSDLRKALLWRRYLVSAWPWRSLAYVLTTVPIAAPLTIVALPWFAEASQLARGRWPGPGLVVVMAVAAALVAAFGPLVAVPLAIVERARLNILGPAQVRSAHRPLRTGPAAWLRTRYSEAATWRELSYALFLGIVVPVGYGLLALLVVVDTAFLTSPLLAHRDPGAISLGTAKVMSAGQAVPYALLGLVLLVLLPYLVGLFAAAQAVVARVLLGDAGGTALREVARSRARLVDAFEAERRRIERDLHDGAQHRLTSLTLQLGMARLDLPDGSPAAAPLTRAHEQAKELMVELRGLIHGIRPQILTDLGLPAAIRELAGQSPIPVTVTGDVGGPPIDGGPAGRAGAGTDSGVGSGVGSARRLPERVESAAYFVVSEALANVVRHSRATRAEVSLAAARDVLTIVIRDDGRGGADPTAGTGLTGLADRVAAVGGRLLLASPAGGPTVVRVELPCGR